jgi:regulator of sirC expression with transglutaminase-like and TPR domain
LFELKENTLADNKELTHLVKLLDDEDENIYASIRERFLSHGNNSSDFLKNYLDDENVLIQKRASEIISTINFEHIENKFRLLSIKNEVLEEGILYVAGYGYPNLNEGEYIRRLDDMALDIEHELSKKNTPAKKLNSLETINVISNYLFYQKGFKGNTQNYYDVDNSYINKVMDRKLGIPISLSVIYILIARRLNIPIHGINIPGHFIIKFLSKQDEFFIDPFNNGVAISKSEAMNFINNIGMSKEEFDKIPYLHKASDKEIILRIMRNLIDIYKNEKENMKVEQLEKLMSCLG